MNYFPLTFRLLCTALLLPLALAPGASGETNVYHIRTARCGGGGVSTSTLSLAGKTWRHAGIAGQSGGVLASSGGGMSHRAGFLPSVNVLQPGLDHNANGVPDELDRDNDGDRLADADELDGTAFQGYAATDHNNPDCDNDDMSDGDESAVLFDPWDPNHRLALLNIDVSGGHTTLRWIGKGGGAVNQIVYSDNLVAQPFTNIVVSAPFTGGDAPWYKITNQYVWAEALTSRFFAVSIMP